MLFPHLTGQEVLKRRLAAAAESGTGHAYLFSGAAGSGRHVFAKAYAQMLLCENPGEEGACGQCDACRHFVHGIHPDFKSLELVEKEKNIKVERVRQLCSDLSMQPQLGTRKIYLIDADNLNEQGQNALLKSLEEPPAYVVFILIASGTHKLLPTVLSRLTNLALQRYSNEQLEQILTEAGYLEGDKLNFLIRYANGLPGRALDLAANEQFGKLRQETADFYLSIAANSRLNLLSEGFSFFDERRDSCRLILSIMSSMIRDQLLLASQADESLMVNQDLAQQLKRTVAEHGVESRTHLWRGYDALREADRAFSLNVSFEVLVCQLLLSLRKELANA
jgi:DNA polymerase-3 subunit delta'